MQPEWRVLADADALVERLAAALCAEAEAAIAARGVFHLVLAGGTTPLALYRALADRRAGDARWHVWYGDERCLPADYPERNSVMLEAAWFAASSIPPENRRPIPAERGAREAAAVYGEWLEGVGDFDVALLGMGEDGHTASLFPGHGWGDAPDSADVLAVHAAPKPPPERVSLSAARLNRSRRVWFVITGSGKRKALLCWKNGETLPASVVRGKLETVAWLDAAAWPVNE
ncbi:6-phosphogluconolactonase [Thiobacillus denitrificans]|uniref:6-phosphogluconolactonase n=1 Tax=Thiobacillus denitrificans TaxID=36861 RepID=A0A106BVQ9_THIDE|nr:6-phosphogluconolactonase [Thiobacillus denitrificans]KVW99549.1 6-phosphogluconolactonase [Thiobacillus denitrificans]